MKGYLSGKTKVKIALLKHGITQTQIARALNVDRSLLSHVLSGKRSRRVVRALARALRMKPRQVERLIYSKNRAAVNKRIAPHVVVSPKLIGAGANPARPASLGRIE